jgi:hypothetical protein
MISIASFISYGANPDAGVVEDGNGNLFGTTYRGGTGDEGTVFEITFPVGTTTTVTSSNSRLVYGSPVAFTASVSAESGSTAPTAGSVDFYDATTSADLGLGTFGSNTGGTSIWTLATSVKTFNVTAGDTITATHTPGTGFSGSSGTTTETVMVLSITVTAVADTKVYDGTTAAAATPTITSGSLVAGDTAAFSETLDTRNVGTGKSLIAVGSVNDGNGGNQVHPTEACAGETCYATRGCAAGFS